MTCRLFIAGALLQSRPQSAAPPRHDARFRCPRKRRHSKVSTYEYLLRRVWSGKDTADRRLVRTYVKRLRRKLGDAAADPAYIVNQRQVG